MRLSSAVALRGVEVLGMAAVAPAFGVKVAVGSEPTKLTQAAVMRAMPSDSMLVEGQFRPFPITGHGH